MIGLLKALGVVKTTAAVAALSAATALGAQAALPAAANLGQSHATARAANATTPDVTDPSTRKDVAAIQAQLAANKARLLATLNAVLTRLQANPNVNPHATAALQKVIGMIDSGNTGLNRANAAVGGAGGSGHSTLPAQAQHHPTPGSHPGKP
jgi:hypothetical protein